MKNLIEIARIVTKKKVKHIEVFDAAYLNQKDNKFNLFYEALATHRLKNDRDAATLLYQSSPTDARYRQLKSRFRKRLLNTLFFLDLNLPHTSGYDRAYFSCNKDWTLVRILLANEATVSANGLARQILTTALKFHFADIIVNCARILRDQSADEGNKKDFEYYDQLIFDYMPVFLAEIEAEAQVQSIRLHLTNRRSDLEKNTANALQKLENLATSHDSAVIMYYKFLAKVLLLETTSHYCELLQVCDEAESYFAGKADLFPEEKLIFFHTRKMAAYLHLQDFKNGKITAEKYLSSFPEGSESWFTFMEFYFLLSVHSKNYIQASAVLEKARQHPKFKKYEPNHREKWRVFGASMLYLMVRLGDEFPVLARQKSNNQLVNAFLDEALTYQKENKNSTAKLLVLKILFLIEKNSLLKAQELIEKLKDFTAKYLKTEENFRLIQFTRLLQQVARANFQLGELKNTEKYLEGLQLVPFKYDDKEPCSEVIPYEHLWALITAQLK